MSTPVTVNKTYILIASVILLVAGSLIGRYGCAAQTNLGVLKSTTTEHTVDSTVYARPRSSAVSIPSAKLDADVTGIPASMNAIGIVGRGQVSGNRSSGDSVSVRDKCNDTNQFYAIIPRPDTLSNGKYANDTLTFRQHKNTIWDIRIGHDPVTFIHYDTVTIIRDSLRITDSVTLRTTSALALDLFTGIQTLGTPLLAGAEFSYTHSNWIYTLQAFSYVLKPGVAFILKYRLF